MTTKTTILPIEHIEYNPKKRRAMVAGTRLSVAFMATFLQDPEWTADRIVENYPFLTHAQVYAAWSYYYDHKEEIDRELKEESERPWIIGVDASEYFADYIKQQKEKEKNTPEAES
jgi:uncharacterized protein (DUF433 family)